MVIEMFRAAITIPPKADPYTQQDMDIVIGHPVVLNMRVNGDNTVPKMTGTIISAEIQEDGSAVITLDVSP
jgi:hypothetical protein